MTDIDRPALAEFADREHKRRDIPDGAFIYRNGDKTFIGYIEQFEVGGQFRPKLSATFVPDSDGNYLHQFLDGPRDSHPDFDQEWTT